MDEHHDSALHYGHVGRAVYLLEEQAWTFTRNLSEGMYRQSVLVYYSADIWKIRPPSSTVDQQRQACHRRTFQTDLNQHRGFPIGI